MVDMANAIDIRLGHCNGKFHALQSKNEKSKNGLFLPTWKPVFEIKVLFCAPSGRTGS